MPTGRNLAIPMLQYPSNAVLDFSPLERALGRHLQAGFEQARLDRDAERLGMERERLGIDRDRFGLERERFTTDRTFNERRLGLETDRLGLDRARFEADRDVNARRVRLESDRLDLAHRAEERTVEDRRVAELANWATRLNEITDPVHRRRIWEERVMRQPELAEALGRNGIDAADFQSGPGFLIAQAADYEARRLNRARTTLAEAQAEATRRRPAMTPGIEAMDRAFAREYVNWTASGGYADIQRQLVQLGGAVRDLRGGQVNLTGPWVGLLPDWARGMTAGGQAAIANRERVEEVVQRSLRAILGAQFTENEGLRLIARAYNPRLEEAENARRVSLLLQQIAAMAEAKESASRHFAQHGTLRGWSGRMPTLTDLDNLFPDGAGTPPPAGGTGNPFSPGTTAPSTSEVPGGGAGTTAPPPPSAEAGGASAAGRPPARPPSVPPGSAYSPSRRQWRAPDGRLFDQAGNPVTP